MFTNGCFDILHVGHVELLKFCRSFNGRVVVGLNSDNSVKRLKGENRPINCEEDRKNILQALKYVDDVIIFDEDTPLKLIKQLKPNIIVKGSDYKIENVVGNDISTVVLFNYVPNKSTTKIINEIKNEK